MGLQIELKVNEKAKKLKRFLTLFSGFSMDFLFTFAVQIPCLPTGPAEAVGKFSNSACDTPVSKGQGAQSRQCPAVSPASRL